MKRSFLFFLAFATFAFGLDRSLPPTPGPAPEVELPPAITKKLPNGLDVIAVSSDRSPTIVFRLVIPGGQKNSATPGEAGMMAALMTKGTLSRTTLDFANEVDFLGASVSASSSADALVVSASSLSRYSNQILGLMQDAAFNPTFPEEEIQKSLMQAYSGLQAAKTDPESMVERALTKIMYGDHAYGHVMTEAELQKINRDSLRALHKKSMVPSGATLAIVGDLPTEAMFALAEDAFGFWDAPAPEEAPDPDFSFSDTMTLHVVERPDSVQSVIRVAMRGLPMDHPDRVSLNPVTSVLGGGFSGRLFANLREKNGYTYGAYLGRRHLKDAGLMVASTSVRNEVTKAAVEEILNELKRIRDEEISEAEFDMHRQYLAGNFMMSLESDIRVAQLYQDQALYGLADDYYANFADVILSTSTEKAQSLAQKHISDTALDIILVADPSIVAELESIAPVKRYDADLNLLN